MTENPRWQEFDPSTFTFIGRNDAAVKWALDFRWEHRLPQPKVVWLLGSGVIEPFTIAALPGMERASVIAVETNPDLLAIAAEIKKGRGIPWEIIAEKSQNPGRENSDLQNPSRIIGGLGRLRGLGSLANLGPGFDQKEMQVSEEVRRRVLFYNGDAEEFLREAVGGEVDIIGDFFLQVNINKHPKGSKYTREMVSRSLESLNADGFLIIGDTGKNLPQTLDHFGALATRGQLNLASMVHAVNFGSGFASSHYLLASKLSDFPDRDQIATSVARRLAGSRFWPLNIRESNGGIHVLWDACNDGDLNIAFVEGDKDRDRPTTWNSTMYSAEKAIEAIVPEKADEFSEEIIFPAQKPHLSKAGTR